MSNATRHTLRNLLSVLVVLAAGLFVVALASRGLVRDPAAEALAGMATVTTQPVVPASPANQPTAATTGIRLIIDYGDGVQKHFITLPHTPGLTAFDALIAAKAHARGVKAASTGNGETAFVTAIDDLTNQGSGKTKKNWQFFVNDTFSTRGPGATPLAPGDTIRWVYDTWRGS